MVIAGDGCVVLELLQGAMAPPGPRQPGPTTLSYVAVKNCG
jgi:hypothetical protein